jgi:hypothetical protein
LRSFIIIIIVEKVLFVIIFIVEKFPFVIIIFLIEKHLFVVIFIIKASSCLDIGEESVSERVDVTRECMDVAHSGMKGLCLRLKGCQRGLDDGDDLSELSLGIPEVLGLLLIDGR